MEGGGPGGKLSVRGIIELQQYPPIQSSKSKKKSYELFVRSFLNLI
jgi:hypothetical protein